MMTDINKEGQIILTSFQLILFLFLLAIAIYKIIQAHKKQANFLFMFYIMAGINISVYLSMMIYQIIVLAQEGNISMNVLVLANVYAIITQTSLIFLLSYYWKQTQSILRNSGVQDEGLVSNIKIQLKIKAIIQLIWTFVYTVFLIFAVVSNLFESNKTVQSLIYYLCQGVSIILLLWANLSQIKNAIRLSSTLKRLQALISSSMNKTKFRCLYIVATTINLLRMIYLVTSTVVIKQDNVDYNQKWILMFVYTATAIIPLSLYLYSFNINNKNLSKLKSLSEDSQRSSKIIQQTTDISPTKLISAGMLPRSSLHQTELSSSYGSGGLTKQI